mmetsp:Transcript_76176/g.123088  ORF Transcript_76176/g.123088 Transcript_76176/m.123088 type:complete len:189 (+) Transcript_76176:61-627(+)
MVLSMAGPRSLRTSRLVLALAVGAALHAQFFAPLSFVPPPLAPSSQAAAVDRAEEFVSVVDLKLSEMGLQLREGLEDGVESAVNAFEEFLGEGEDLVGPSLNPQLLPAGCSPFTAEKSLLEKVLEPVTKFFLRYQRNMEPRCKECKMIIRFGRIVRTCIIPRHKARQPGISGFKKKMNNIKGSWKQLR